MTTIEFIWCSYHIDEKELGSGLYGTVRKCRHRETGQWCAVKSIKKKKVSEIEALKREITILQQVKHNNIIKLIDVFEDERYLHLVTELCTGGELFDRIIEKFESEEGHFSEYEAATLVYDVVDAIRYCHSLGIVHRDLKPGKGLFFWFSFMDRLLTYKAFIDSPTVIGTFCKPENFLFQTSAEDSKIKIIDFGLSRRDNKNNGVMSTRVGTPYYVAPEVLKQKYTKACDCWSIGVICYILLVRNPVYKCCNKHYCHLIDKPD